MEVDSFFYLVLFNTTNYYTFFTYQFNWYSIYKFLSFDHSTLEEVTIFIEMRIFEDVKKTLEIHIKKQKITREKQM